MNKYPTWARLNPEGKRIWGNIFPDGLVPVQNIATQHTRLEGIKDIESVFTIDWIELTKAQQQDILENLSERTGTTKEAIVKEILKAGLPLRRRYTVSCGTNRMQFFT